MVLCCCEAIEAKIYSGDQAPQPTQSDAEDREEFETKYKDAVNAAIEKTYENYWKVDSPVGSAVDNA